MKHYKNLFLFPFIIIISVTVLSGFGNNSNTGIVKDLMKERTSILQQTYYGELNSDIAEDKLSNIETQPLLESDILTLRAFKNTEIDMIRDMEIISLKRITKLYDYLSFHGTIRWHMSGLNGEYVETVDYCIVLKSFGRIYKISDIYPINRYQ